MKAGFRFPTVAIVASVIFPCAFDTSPGFIPGGRPEQADTRFMRGELGILTSALQKRYELIAWRYLSNLPLNADEQKAPSSAGAPTLSPGSQDWLKARSSLSGLNRVGFLLTSRRSRIAPGVFFQNCLDSAFTSAIAILRDRQQRYGSNELLMGWVRAQDLVFENCSGDPPAYPPDPDPKLPPLARADRLYQIAAAHFYAEDLEGAASRFRELGDPYMVARTLLRKYSLLGDEAALQQAQTIFSGIQPASPLYNSARGLLQLIDCLRKPESVYGELAGRLSIPHPGPDFGKTILDAVYAMTSGRYQAVFAKIDLPEPFDWIRSLESHRAEHATDRWKETHSIAWLTVALINAKAADANAQSLIEAGLLVPESSPAFATVRSNAIGLMIERGDHTAARRELSSLLAKKQPLLSVENAFRGERMSVATDFNDFLRWASRRPIGYADNDLEADNVNSAAVLDVDSVSVLNHLTPLSKLAAAAESGILPTWISTKIAHVAWTRAFLMGDNAVVGRMLPILRKAHPDWSAELTEGKFRGAMLILRHAAFTDRLPVGFEAKGWSEDRSCPLPLTEITPPALTVLSKTERELAAHEYQLIRTGGTTQAALLPLVMARLKSNPDDPDLPEALHRMVLLTRYGCRPDPRNGSISKQAFDILHERFPGSPWTTRTPYWFKD